MTDEGDDKRRLIRESRQLMAEYTNDCRAQQLIDSAADAVQEEKRLVETERASEKEEREVSEKESELV